MPTGKFLHFWKVFAGYFEIELESIWTIEEVRSHQPRGLKDSVLLGKFLVDLESSFYGWGSFQMV